jgi:hypothetical protein
MKAYRVVSMPTEHGERSSIADTEDGTPQRWLDVIFSSRAEAEAAVQRREQPGGSTLEEILNAGRWYLDGYGRALRAGTYAGGRGMSPKTTILVLLAAAVAAIVVFHLVMREVTQDKYNHHLIERQTGSQLFGEPSQDNAGCISQRRSQAVRV